MSALVYYAFLAVSISIATAQPAHAYLDPGTGSIILQSLIGAVAAGLVFGRAYIHRIKAWLGMVAEPGSKNGQQPPE